ncbi:hypothetical protein D3C71_1788490 [compost metagenome]
MTPLVCTSRSAMPAALIAASTLVICSAFWRMAVLPSTAWVTTPAESVATSGTRLASALAEMLSRVPSAGTAMVGWDWAWAVIEAPRARDRASSNGDRDGRRMYISL